MDVPTTDTNATVPTGTTTAWPSSDYCASRLPCGVCLILDRMCPKIATYKVEPTWYQNGPTCINPCEVTCNGSV